MTKSRLIFYTASATNGPRQSGSLRLTIGLRIIALTGYMDGPSTVADLSLWIIDKSDDRSGFLFEPAVLSFSPAEPLDSKVCHRCG